MATKKPAESLSLAQLRASQETKPKETFGLSQLRGAQEMARGIAMARNPNYDTAMAQQNYANFMADQQAKLAAERGQFTQGRLMGAPSGGMGGNVQLGQEPIPPFIPKGMGGSVQYGQEPIPPFIPKGMGGSVQYGQEPIPPFISRPAMQQFQIDDYNNLLRQGIQNSNTMNQNGMANFANIQPRMPLADRGIQQPRQTPAPRKFSTVKSPSIRFG